MKVVPTTLIFCILLTVINSQACKNHNGGEVHWWVSLKVPPKIGASGFGYYDSTYGSGTFQYIPNHIDEGASALTMTLHQINEMNL
jgi:hypothetical protein